MNPEALISWWKLLLAASAAIAVLGVGVLGLATIEEPTAEPGECPPVLESARGTVDPVDPAVAHVLVLIDPSTNDPADARFIARRVEPVVTPHLESGLTLEVIVDPGANNSSVISECLDGSGVFAVRNANDVRQRRDLSEAAKAFTDLIEEMIVAAPVGETGGPIGLLRHARLAGELVPEESGTLVVMLWSDLLANDGSCLDPEGSEASEEVARAVVARCVAVDAVSVIDADVMLLGVGQSPRSAGFEYWADLVAGFLCDELAPSDGCSR